MTPMDKGGEWSANVPTGMIDIVGWTGRAVFAAFALFLAWAVLVPLDSAVVVPGEVISEGRNQVLQHPAGGVIRQIHVRDGDLVEVGDVIVELDPAIDRARLSRLRARSATLQAMLSRLEAERQSAGSGLDTTKFQLRGVDKTITAALPAHGSIGGNDWDLKTQLKQEQARELEKGRQALKSQISALESRANGLRDQRRGYRAQTVTLDRQLASLRSQRDGAQSLVTAGQLARQQLWSIDEQLAERERQLAEIQAANMSAEDSIAEIDAQIAQIRMDDEHNISRQVTDALSELAEIRDELAAAELALSQTAMRAPVSGHLVHFAANTVGGVVGPAETIGEIVPNKTGLKLEMRVSINDIAAVALEQDVEFSIGALNPRLYDKLPAKLSYIAQDSSLDETTGMRYYVARADIDLDSSDPRTGILRPGMIGEAFIRGHARTFAAYLLDPITENFDRSLREPR